MHSIQQKLLRLSETLNIGILSFRELGKMIDEEHPQTVKYHLEQLERKGLIEWNRETGSITRNNVGVASNTDFIVIPILGLANCGPATIFAEEYIQGHVKVSVTLIKNRRRVFAIKAVGHSMNRANIDGKTIEEGDLVIVDPEDKNIGSNDYVLSIIDGMANIKKIVMDFSHEQLVLLSESSYFYPAIYIHLNEADKFLVNGKIIQVIKRHKMWG